MSILADRFRLTRLGLAPPVSGVLGRPAEYSAIGVHLGESTAPVE
jgi:hypothetical protein